MAVQQPPRRPVVGSLAGMAMAKNIGRRQCSRIVPMKVLCFGLSRTGTSSLRQALLDLGYNDVYHFASCLNENPKDAEMWLEAIDGKCGKGKPFTRRDWDQLLGHCMAVTDTPVVWFHRELLEAYPEAKVILTLRDSPEQWWQSQMNTLIKYMSSMTFPAPGIWTSLVGIFGPPKRTIDKLSAEISLNYAMYQDLLRDSQTGTRDAQKFYVDHAEDVKTLVPKERLLVMNVKDGWKPLCAFLEKDVPPWDFPRANSGEEFLENAADITHGDMAPQVFGPHPTPAIFARKWMSKLEPPFKEQDSYDSSEVTIFCNRTLDLVLAFNADAAALGMTSEIMPPEHAANLPGPMKNPFEVAQQRIIGANTIMINWIRLRDGEIIGGERWQDMDSAYRTKVNAILLKVDEAVDAGLWKLELDQGFVQQMMMHAPSVQNVNNMGVSIAARQYAIANDLAKSKSNCKTKSGEARKGVPKWF
ncbi:hypothetical protein HII31_04271 [Pseudocercospora fuligena]|uniref:Sulfotransferase domain-containing protein n=1 Tax=Pseudocercospora fuligena TaxID=685502 RepID=A0A8H6RQM4_9PEZI|nr:hypothetical protein HII31_04271 [Pseudocercospora fuligena]